MKLAIVSLLLLSACNQVTAEPTKAVDTEVEAAKVTVLARMRDPGSAQFGDVALNDKGIVCGSVNAHNGFGGYAGAQAFWFDPKTAEVYLATEAQDAWGKQYDAKVFQKKGCPSGLERMLNL